MLTLGNLHKIGAFQRPNNMVLFVDYDSQKDEFYEYERPLSVDPARRRAEIESAKAWGTTRRGTLKAMLTRRRNKAARAAKGEAA